MPVLNRRELDESFREDWPPGGRRGALENLIRSAPKAEPTFVEPMKCKPVTALPKSTDWLYEIKLDGYRALAIKSGREVKLISRNRKDFSARYPEIVESLRTIKLRQATLDGEMTVLNERGLPSFEGLQTIDKPGGDRTRLFYYVFDILNYEGRDITRLPLEMRKSLLRSLIGDKLPRICVVRAVKGAGPNLLQQINEHGLEGLVGKRSHSVYQAGQRSGAWIKYKILNEQEFVIGGYARPERTREWFGALVIGYYNQGKLHYASKVGTGFTPEMIRTLYRRMQPLVQDTCPFVNLPDRSSGRSGQSLTAAELRRCTWVKPTLVCEVHFTEWTEGGHLRHPSFKGLREDKEPREVVREAARGQPSR
jgi:bifunctional non-homologous end joining protein LigD